MERPLTQDIRSDGVPLDLKDYESKGGYQAARKALKEMEPAAVTETVKASNLRGRGGAGFPTGVKWSFVPMGEDAPRPKYLLCNADEMEPGTFKDRYLLEGNPHQLIEALLVSAYAMQAEVAYIFIRWAYKRAATILQQALAEAREAGYLGRNVLRSGFDLEIRLHASAGRYICGEETGLINALEGRRANPRAKPPFPPVAG
ncbi:MAG: NADH-quinone oxidoreductase subunit F, partial [Candidatus Eisenbacteria bacterium]|nr:NADH-quinone oxidoreductase subunit F [Candidatus Eisenbacteria bacterium]